MAKYLLDTTVLINYLRGVQDTVTLLKSMARAGHALGCCCINVAEVYSGLRERDRSAARVLLESLYYYEAPVTVAQRAGEFRNHYLREGITLSTSDAIVAAVAEAEGAILLTGNVRHYPMAENINVQLV